MNILLCKNSFTGLISGADEIMVNYAVELKAAGHNVSVLLVQPPLDNHPLYLRLNAAGVSLTALATPKFTASFASARRLAIALMQIFSPVKNLIRSNSRKIVFNLLQRYNDAFCGYLKKTKPDIVHVITPDPGAVMLIRAAHSLGIPVIYQEVGIPFHPPGFEEVYERFVEVLPLCSEVAVLSPLLAKQMSQILPGIGEPKVLPLISPPVEQKALSHRPNTGKVTFGFAARLEHLKGPVQLVEGFKKAQKNSPVEIELKIAGDGSLRQLLDRILRESGLEKNCQFVGTYYTLEERSRFMSGIDIFVLPSLTEGTPNAIIEAMAHGKPIIATNVGGIPDLVAEAVGCLVEVDDVKALGAAMRRLAGDAELRKTMGIASKKRYEQLFTAAAVLPLLTGIYEQTINRHFSGEKAERFSDKAISHPWTTFAIQILSRKIAK